jgi:hypothetical protein
LPDESEYRGLYIWKSIFGAPVGDDLEDYD